MIKMLCIIFHPMRNLYRYQFNGFQFSSLIVPYHESVNEKDPSSVMVSMFVCIHSHDMHTHTLAHICVF